MKIGQLKGYVILTICRRRVGHGVGHCDDWSNRDIVETWRCILEFSFCPPISDCHAVSEGVFLKSDSCLDVYLAIFGNTFPCLSFSQIHQALDIITEGKYR